MITSSEIIQLDATIIAGVMILLTISNFKRNWEHSSFSWLKISPKKAVGFIVIPFSISALTFFFQIVLQNPNDLSYLIFASIWSIIGFTYLIIVVIFIKSARPPDTETTF